jgi:hypothetical protein
MSGLVNQTYLSDVKSDFTFDAALGSADLMARDLQPLTERVLARLPGARWRWITAWALVPWLKTPPSTSCSAPKPRAQSGNRAQRSLLGTGATAAAFAASALADHGVLAALVRGVTWLVIGTALWTFLWTYVSLQVGLYRIGGERVVSDAARMEPGLGLRPLGDVAFTGLWILLACVVPVVLTGLPDVVGVVIGGVILTAALTTFFLSLVRLHHQMVAVKAEELALARELYAEAYAPVRESPTLETLTAQSGALAAAEALEKRARAIHDWPIDEGTLARVLTIATSVVAITIGRLILDPFGL